MNKVFRKRITSFLLVILAIYSSGTVANNEGNFQNRKFEDFLLVMNCDKRAVEFFYYETQADTGNSKRSSTFYKDKELPENCQQTSTKTYRSPIGTFDRGHMVPANHFDSDKNSIYATNTMSNIHPQHPNLNRGAWLRTEEFIECAREVTKLQVFGGPIWGENKDNDYFVQSHGIETADFFWKAVFNPMTKEIFAWVFPNDATPTKSKTEKYRVSFSDLLALINDTVGIRIMRKFSIYSDGGVWPHQTCDLS